MFKKFKGRYAEQKVSERDVMSYEDMPLDDYEQEKTDISPEAIKKIIIGVCIALLAGLIVFAFSNRDKLTLSNISNWWTYDVLGNAGNGYPVSLIGVDVEAGNFALNQGHIAYASDTSFVTLNSTGREVANVQLRYSQPILKASDNTYLTYGLGDTGYQIQSFDKNLYSGETEGIVYTGDIVSNGTYCLVTEGGSYLTTLLVFNKDNNRIFKYSFSEYYINSVALKPDGSGCVACGITSSGGEVQTGVYVLDFGKEEPVAKYEIKGDVVLDSKYLNNSRTVLIGETNSYVIKSGAEEYITVSYNDMPLTNYAFNPDTNMFTLALSRSGDGRSCVLKTFNDNGDEKSSIDTDYGAKSLAMYKGTIGVLDGNIAYTYNHSGELTNKCYTGTGSKKIILDSDKNAYILSINQIRYLDLSKTSTDDTANR